LIAVPILLLMFSFLLYHQLADTGFYTDEFGFLEMVCLYGPAILALIAPIARVVTGRRNPARPFEAFTNLIQTFTAIWLLTVFPFDYTHLADALPGPIRFVLSWVTDDIARIIFIIMIIASPITAMTNLWRYVTFPRFSDRGPARTAKF
jgi:hypothetical protein